MRRHSLISGILAVVLVCASAHALDSNDFEWKTGQGLLGLNSGSVMTTWDPDGNGPHKELLIVGGFSVAGDMVANNIAAWDGNSWQPLGSGINGSVRALTVYNGELIAGGEFTKSLSE